jgi:hypothetical protein
VLELDVRTLVCCAVVTSITNSRNGWEFWAKRTLPKQQGAKFMCESQRQCQSLINLNREKIFLLIYDLLCFNYFKW